MLIAEYTTVVRNDNFFSSGLELLVKFKKKNL